VDVITFIDQFDGSTAHGVASVGPEELDGFCPSTTSRDVIDGTPSQVVATTSPANQTVLEARTSTRSRPASHRTDEPEEMARRVVGDAPPGS
jgi:hypothetical protein